MGCHFPYNYHTPVSCLSFFFFYNLDFSNGNVTVFFCKLKNKCKLQKCQRNHMTWIISHRSNEEIQSKFPYLTVPENGIALSFPWSWVSSLPPIIKTMVQKVSNIRFSFKFFNFHFCYWSRSVSDFHLTDRLHPGINCRMQTAKLRTY